MNTQTNGQTLALAGCLQALSAVNKLANEGRWVPEEVLPLIRSLYIFEPERVQEIISVDDCQPGLALLIAQSERKLPEQAKLLIEYLIMIQSLERQLSKDDSKLERIRKRLEQLEPDASFDWLDNSHMQRLDGLYQEVVSTLPRRIMVRGEANHLQNDLTAARIRALLLSSIRLTILWRQKGGTRLNILFNMRKYHKAAQALVH